MVKGFAVTSILSVGLIAQAPPSPSQDRFTAALVRNRYQLSVRDGQLSGTGATVLQTAIAQSRFVLLGEYHGVAQTSEFLSAVCRMAAPEGFRTMAVEEGPLVTAELEGWAKRPDGMKELAAFIKQHPESIAGSGAREEFGMLQQCARAAGSDFHLWGLNQEMYGAAGPMLSRILASPLGKESRAAMQQLLDKANETDRKAAESGRVFDLYMMSADDKELASGSAALQKDGSPEARSLFASFVESHEINRTSPAEYSNARRRERLMKTQFAANYARAARGAAAPPKILLKFGALHIYRGLNPVRGSGIGNYVAEFAEAQGAQSLHIYLMPVRGSQPIHPRVGRPSELIPFNLAEQPGFRYMQPMLSNLLGQDWTMFDLRPLRQDSNRPGGTINAELAGLIFGYDIVIVVPDSTPVTDIG